MGCDGGTIPRRDELVKTKKKPEAKDKDSERLYRWRHCAASQKKLCTPIVACELGRLYNKDEVIFCLLEKTGGETVSHIRGLKDIKELTLSNNPSYKEISNSGSELISDQTSKFICPITSVEMNGKSKFFFIWSCGCVLSDRALKEIKSDTCHNCNKPFEDEDLIILNPNEEQLPLMRSMMVSRRERAKAAKKLKKEGKRNIDQVPSSSSGESSKKKQIKSIEGKAKSLLVTGMASNVLQDSEFQKIRSSNYSVASDPQASEVYKSLFDTHKTAQKKPSAHWVTCNPQYF